MKLAMVGLGRMGMNMAKRLIRRGQKVVAYNRTPDKVKEMEKEGAIPAYSLSEAVEKLEKPRILWLMVPAGPIVDELVGKLAGMLSDGDIVIDGGNSYYKNALISFKKLGEKGIHFVDAGVSGGVWGLEVGYCLMVGGEKGIYEYLEPVFKALAPRDGYLYCGESGAGHFVKMVHNGIEYGMMQAYGEGFELLVSSPYGGRLDLSKVAHLWNQGSVVRSWLLELSEEAFREDPDLSSIRGFVDDSGEGRWTVQQAIDTGVSAPIITLSLFQRFRSRMKETFADKVLAALRHEFGGHAVKEASAGGDTKDKDR